MLGETENQFSLTCTAFSKGRHLESNFSSVQFISQHCLRDADHWHRAESKAVTVGRVVEE